MSQTQSDHPQPKPDPTTPTPSSLFPDHAPYLKLDPNDVTTHSPPPPASDPSTESPISGVAATTSKTAESNTYVSPAPAPRSYFKNMALLGKWGKKTAETPKKGQDLAGNMWQHLKTGPSFADAAVGRIALRTRVMAEGGYEKMFGSTFETTAEEQLLKSYACYLSTLAGRLMGILYLSTAKLAFCSDNPLSYDVGGMTEWSYYKVVIPLHHLKAVNPSTSRANAAEKRIQVISVDNYKFTFLGFLQYDSAVKNLRGSVPHHTL